MSVLAVVCSQALGHSRLCEAAQGQRWDQVGSNRPITDTLTRAHMDAQCEIVSPPLRGQAETIQYDTRENIHIHNTGSWLRPAALHALHIKVRKMLQVHCFCKHNQMTNIILKMC